MSNSFNSFSANLGAHAQLNSQNAIENSTEGATFGIGKFSDLTPQEFKAKYLQTTSNQPDPTKREGKIVTAETVATANADGNKRNRRNLQATSDTMPSAYDWRNYGVVSNVKNQFQCGDCWAFTTAANLEGQYALKYNKLLSFSPQQILDCDTMDWGCDGGYVDNALDYIKQTGGLYQWNSYDEGYYNGEPNEYCLTSSSFIDNTSNIVAKVDSWYYVTGDEDFVAQYLWENGPLAVSVNAALLQTYISGIIIDPGCSTVVDHSVLLVGYGVSTVGTPYWIIKNTWGPNWGENGFFRLLRGSNLCGVNTFVVTGTVQ